MRRIRYLSGNQTGQEHDVPDTEAENLIASGFAQDASSAPPPAIAAPAPPPTPAPAPKPERARSQKRPAAKAPKGKRKGGK